MRGSETMPIVKPHGETYMKRLMTMLSAAGLVLAFAISSWGQAKMLPTPYGQKIHAAFRFIVFEQPTKPFTTLNRAVSTRLPGWWQEKARYCPCPDDCVPGGNP